MKIAMLGTRGLPAAYSGFETAVENLGSRLAARGHEVVVYCRPHMVEGRRRFYKGMRLVYVPTIRNKYLDTFVHSFLCTLHMGLFVRPSVAIYFIAGNSPFARLSRLLGVPSILNVDGLDSERAKWPAPAKAYLRWAERNAPRFATRTVTDSRTVQRLYRERHHAETVYIPYGSTLPDGDSEEVLERFGLQERGYILFVGRLVPENNAHVLVEAFAGLATDVKLVVVGDSSYADDYQRALRDCEDPRVLFTGYLFGEGYRTLLRNAAIFVAPTEVGGTHPVIIEAMGAGNCVVVNDHEPNLETIGDAGAAYKGSEGPDGLRSVLRSLLDDPASVQRYRALATARARDVYSWDAVSRQYEELAAAVLTGISRRAAR
ncbi:MAG TPA: glycosyltransferase [Coriobacteriia bacterium]|nr:glycosyltransferase [Coriobacteriia bacterium]